jgi:hypothetical protein
MALYRRGTSSCRRSGSPARRRGSFSWRVASGCATSWMRQPSLIMCCPLSPKTWSARFWTWLKRPRRRRRTPFCGPACWDALPLRLREMEYAAEDGADGRPQTFQASGGHDGVLPRRPGAVASLSLSLHTEAAPGPEDPAGPGGAWRPAGAGGQSGQAVGCTRPYRVRRRRRVVIGGSRSLRWRLCCHQGRRQRLPWSRRPAARPRRHQEYHGAGCVQCRSRRRRRPEGSDSVCPRQVRQWSLLLPLELRRQGYQVLTALQLGKLASWGRLNAVAPAHWYTSKTSCPRGVFW